LALQSLALLRVNRRDAERAEAVVAELEPILERVGTLGGRAWYHTLVGMLRALQGDLSQARRELEAGIKAASDAGFLNIRDFADMVLGMLITDAGEHAAAVPRLRQLRDRIRQQTVVDMRRLLGTSAVLSHALVENGEFDEARAVMRDAISIGRKIGVVSVFLDRFIYVIAKAGRAADAARLAGWAEERFKKTPFAAALSRQIHLRLDPVLREKLSAVEIERLAAEGVRMSEDEALALAAA
jgi:hypothetical protein